ncbi:MAG: hypothetical protein IT493_11970 [Gammaproteobacteria bacterium]|nr:hypothetical protein [Gammaproteobacteria bacterium]
MLPELPIEASDYDRHLRQRLAELLAGLQQTVEPLIRYKVNGDALIANSDESGGVEWGAVQGTIWRAQHVRVCEVGGASAVPQQVGFDCANVATGGGSATHTAPSGTAALTSLYRIVHASGGGAGTNNTGSAMNARTAAFWLGNAAGLGGFRGEWTFGIETTRTDLRLAAGLFDPAAALSLAGEPSAYLNGIFCGVDSGDANLQIMHNDGAGACTKIDLGASFARATGMLLRLVLESTANSGTVTYTVTRLDSAASATGTISTNLPANTFFMTPQFAAGRGATPAGPAAKGALVRILMETPY